MPGAGSGEVLSLAKWTKQGWYWEHVLVLGQRRHMRLNGRCYRTGGRVGGTTLVAGIL